MSLPNRQRKKIKKKYAPVRTGGQIRLEQIRLIVAGLFASAVLAALQSTLLGRIHVPPLSPTSPSLTLLLVIAVGFYMGEKEGAILGVIAGILADAVNGSGIMLLPLLYFVIGYVCGFAGRNFLAHNLPCFMMYAAMGGGCEMILYFAVAAYRVGGIPPSSVITNSLLPRLILTLLFAPPIYGTVGAYVKKRIKT